VKDQSVNQGDVENRSTLILEAGPLGHLPVQHKRFIQMKLISIKKISES